MTSTSYLLLISKSISQVYIHPILITPHPTPLHVGSLLLQPILHLLPYERGAMNAPKMHWFEGSEFSAGPKRADSAPRRSERCTSLDLKEKLFWKIRKVHQGRAEGSTSLDQKGFFCLILKWERGLWSTCKLFVRISLGLTDKHTGRFFVNCIPLKIKKLKAD